MLFDREKAVYTSRYCEENIILLCETFQSYCSPRTCPSCGQSEGNGEGARLESFAVFISNERKQVPLWHQSASCSSENPILWDYHGENCSSSTAIARLADPILRKVVFLLRHLRKDKSVQCSVIFDFDSDLPWGDKACSYVHKTFAPDMSIVEDYRQYFRVVNCQQAVEEFASDRSHMRNQGTDTWLASPPAYPPLRGPKSSSDMSLDSFLDMRSGSHLGVVYSVRQFLDFVSPTTIK
jgi:hypothetical protein